MAPSGQSFLAKERSDATLRQRKPVSAGNVKVEEQVEEETKEDSTFGKTPAGNGEPLSILTRI
jgi:hypothetical protein